MATGPEVYDATTTTVLSNLYDDLGETLNHLKSLKLMSYPGGDVSAYCDVILVDDEWLESSVVLKSENLGYTTLIFEYTYDYIFYIW